MESSKLIDYSMDMCWSCPCHMVYHHTFYPYIYSNTWMDLAVIKLFSKLLILEKKIIAQMSKFIVPIVESCWNSKVKILWCLLTCLDGMVEWCCITETSVAGAAVCPSVTTTSTDFSFHKNLVFWNLFEFSAAEITKKPISPTFWIQILPNKFH